MEDDIIQTIKRKAIANVKDYESVAADIQPDELVLLLVFRKGATVWITIAPSNK
jgi:hypothetical protein